MVRAKVRVGAVAVGDDLDFRGPIDRESWIVPAYAARRFGSIDLGHLVEDFSFVGERKKTVRAAFGDVYKRQVVSIEK